MLKFLPAPLLGVLMFTLMAANTAFFSLAIILLSPLRLFIPLQSVRDTVANLMMALADAWCFVNNRLLYRLLPHIGWDINYPPGLHRHGWYMVCANHQSWVDIMVLFYVFAYRIPFLKYFLKQELIWIPLVGLALQAMDFPFMKRYSRETLQKHPELKGKDVETTRRVCAKYKHTPVSVINFLEGTRITPKKYAEQQSPYRHLLKPKAGGLAFVLSALGPQMDQMLDVTIHYPDGIPTFWDFTSGRMRRVVVHIEPREIPAEFFGKDYENDAAFRAEFQAWVGDLWEQKDQLLDQLKTESASTLPHV